MNYYGKIVITRAPPTDGAIII